MRALAAQQAEDMKQSLAIAGQSAIAAKKSADIAERSLLDLKSPYIIVRVRVLNILTPFRIDDNHEKSLIIYNVSIKNFGRSPCYYYHIVLRNVSPSCNY